MKLVPIGDNVVIKPLEPEGTTAGGIVLPDSARERSSQGRVLSVGDGHLLPDGGRVRHQVHEGDRVLYAQYAGAAVAIDGETLLIVAEKDILAVVEPAGQCAAKIG